MGDDEARREDARIEAAIERSLKRGTMGICACGDITSQKVEDPDTGEMYWVCFVCSKDEEEDDEELS